jgi:hypothetical protein
VDASDADVDFRRGDGDGDGDGVVCGNDELSGDVAYVEFDGVDVVCGDDVDCVCSDADVMRIDSGVVVVVANDIAVIRKKQKQYIDHSYLLTPPFPNQTDIQTNRQTDRQTDIHTYK